MGGDSSLSRRARCQHASPHDKARKMIELFKLKNKAKLKSVTLWRKINDKINDVLVALIILILSACVASVIFQMI